MKSILHLSVLCLVLMFCYSIPVHSQAPTIINLSSPETGEKTHVAQQEINFYNGYHYEATSNRMHAYIGNYANYSNPYTKTEFDNHGIDQNRPVGYTPGSASVSNTGSANYSIPIIIPSGTNGLLPELSLSYNSQIGNGVLGIGWNVGPISSITMANTTWYQDAEVQEVDLDGEDRFLLDGQRLHVVSGSYGSDAATYKTELESYQKITSYGTGGIPIWFKLETKDGLTIEYGKTEESRRTNLTGNKIVEWRINRITDLNGNYVQYVYLKEGTNSILDRIRYTGNTIAGVSPYNEVKFHYAEREDKNEIYIAGIGFEQNYVLDQIEIYAEGEFSKRYDFEYAMNNTSLLKSITERGADLSSLNSTIFKYGDESADFEQIACSSFAGVAMDVFASRDFNSDGRSDVLIQHYFYDTSIEGSPKTYTHWEVLTSETDNSFAHYAGGAIPTGYQLFFDHNVDDIEIRGMSSHLDFYGDGSDDILLVKVNATGAGDLILSAMTILDINGLDDISSYSIPVSPGGYITSDKYLHLGDFDGDGKDDILLLKYGSPGSYTYFGKLITDHSGEQNVDLQGLAYLASAQKYTSSDFDGDGKEEIMVFYSGSCEIFELNSKPSTGTFPYKVEKIYHNVFPSYTDEIRHGDFNGDGKTDLLVGNGSSWSVAYSTGVGYDVRPFTFSTTPDVSSSSETIEIGDFNGDGQSDIFHIHDISATSNFDKYYSNGISFNLKQNTGPNFYPYNNAAVGDYNGDGKDVIFRTDNWPGTFSGFFYFDKDGTEYLLDKVKDGLGRETHFHYTWLPKNENYSKTAGSVNHPVRKVHYPFSVVKTMLSEDGVGGMKQINYSYEDALFHFQGKGFLGFLKTVSEDITMGTRAISTGELNVDYNYVQPVLQRNELISGALISETGYNFIVTPLGGVRYDARVGSSSSYNQLNDVTTTINYTYDGYGNLTKKKIANGRENTNITYTYGTFGLWWIPSAQLTKNVYNTRIGETSFVSKMSYTYDASGRLTQEVSQPTMAKAVTTKYEYDVFGNEIKRTISAADAPTILTRAKYDAIGRFPFETTNPLGQKSYASYDKKWGAAITSTDISGFVTTGTYDAFGRQLSSVEPSGLESHTQLFWDFTSGTATPTSADNTVYKIVNQVEGSPSKTTWYDLLERPVKEKTEGLTDDIWSVKKFTEKGQEYTVTNVFYDGETPLVSTSLYDDYGRVISVSDGISTTNYSYSTASGELTVTMNHPAQTRTQTTDQAGRVIQTTDNAGTIDTEYFSNGRKKSISVQGVMVQQMTYDDYGNQISLIDKDAGTTTYDFNSYHAIISQTDANGDTHTKTYDVMGREISSNGPDGATVTTYVTSGNGINEVSSISNPYGVTTSYVYDSYNRLTSTAESVDAESFITSFAYDDMGRIAETTYPSGFKVKNEYNTIGELINVKDETESISFFSAPVKNAKGQYTAYTLGNGKTTEFTYDELGLLETIYAAGIQDYEVSFNQVTGNLTERKDHIHNRKETFNYDASHRLKKATISMITTPVLIATPLEIEYDNNGNITEKSDVGIYNYDVDKIHAVTSIDNSEGSISLMQQDVTYTSFDRTATVSEGDHHITFTYGSALNRIKSVQSFAGDVVKTKYYVGSYEKEVTPSGGTREIHYIPTGNGASVVFVVEGGIGKYHYMYTDHLGSVVAVTDDAGVVEFEQSFDPWGQRRNAATWTGTMSVPATFSWLRGFTGHEHHDEFGLINMNNRMYDPIIGRMLAVDNFIQNPDLTQNYNRYSYVMNNPLGYTDPSGELFYGPIIAGAVVGAIAGAVISHNNGAPVWRGAVTGALIGASIGYTFSSALTAAFYWPLDPTNKFIYALGRSGGKPVIKGTRISSVSRGFSILSNGLITSGVNMISYSLQTLSPNVEFDPNRLVTAGLIGFGAGVAGGMLGTAGTGGLTAPGSLRFLFRTNLWTGVINGTADRIATSIFSGHTIMRTTRNAIFGAAEGLMGADIGISFSAIGVNANSNRVLRSLTSYGINAAVTSVPGLSSFIYSFVGPFRTMNMHPYLFYADLIGVNMIATFVHAVKRWTNTTDYGYEIGNFVFGPRLLGF